MSFLPLIISKPEIIRTRIFGIFINFPFWNLTSRIPVSLPIFIRSKNILPHGVVLYFEHSIVAVCRRRDFDPDYEKSYAALEDLLKRLSLKVYISTRFYRFTELSMAYGQCRLMKSYPLEPQKHIQRFDEAFLHVLYGVLKEKNLLAGLLPSSCFIPVAKPYGAGSHAHS